MAININRNFKKPALLLMLLLAGFYSHAQLTSVQSGPWLAWQTWNAIPPGLTDSIIIKHNVTVSQDWGLQAGGSITIDSGGSLSESLPGLIFGQYGGKIINNGTIVFANYAVLGGLTTNNDSMHLEKALWITGVGSLINYGKISDVDSIWNDGILANIGANSEITGALLYNSDSLYNEGGIGFMEGLNESGAILANYGNIANGLFLNNGKLMNHSGSTFNSVDYWNNAYLWNDAGASLNIFRDFLNGDTTLLPLSGSILENDGFVGVGRDFYNTDSIVGSTGQICITRNSFNWGYIGGAIDICDATGGGIDQDIGTIEPTVTTCNSSCALVVSVQENHPTCDGGSDGSVVVKASGGSGTYTYTWTIGSTVDSVGGLPEGIYVVMVTDGVSSVFVLAKLSTDAIVTLVTSNPTTCGLDNGEATASAIQGKSPYSYLWNDPNSQVTKTATGMAQGIYSVTVTDANGCSVSDTAKILGTSGLSITENMTPASCADVMDGEINLTITGGTPPYDYAWSPDVSTGPEAIGLDAGEYNILITDVDSCLITSGIAVTVGGGADCEDWKIFSGITPNGDGVDDKWEIRGLEPFQPVVVEIFTNRGILVWNSDDYNNDWDGTDLNGDPLIEGVYYYVVVRSEEVNKGWVHIVR